MPGSQEKILEMIRNLQFLQEYSRSLVEEFSPRMQHSHPLYRESLKNLLHYLAIRSHDIRSLQRDLGQLGISRLGKAESHVMASLIAIHHNLQRIVGQETQERGEDILSFNEGKRLLAQHVFDLLGPEHNDRQVRIMVTLPTEAAYNFDMVKAMLEAGVNCVRINCAHDNESVWKLMVDNVKRAIEETALPCKISMDLAGPKLRTGKMQDGPKVLRVKPQRDEFGRVTKAAYVWLSYPENADHCPIEATFIPVQQEWIGSIEAGDVLRMRDSRQKKRKLTVEKQTENGILAYSTQTIYFMTGIPLQAYRDDSLVAETRIGELAKLEQSIILRPGDLLIMHEEDIPGENSLYNEKGEKIKDAHISCLIPELYDYVKSGEMILLDDGKIEASVESCQERKLNLRILHAKPTGSRLKADKGINLPTSELHIRGLTEKDKVDLKFVAEHADIVNFSFVNESNDVEDLLTELEALQAPDKLGIILKIETRNGFENLPDILMSAMRSYPLGVMIARGDLAVECGWKHLAQVQEEILRICEAAHIPIVWATQVLENLAKTGLPSRAEITDAAMAQRAECVMLNKGPYILNAIRMLDEILRSMQDFQQKKAPMLPSLNIKSPLGKQ